MKKKEVLRITSSKKLNQSLDGVAWDRVDLVFDITITSNEELSNVINSLRLLRPGSPENHKIKNKR